MCYGIVASVILLVFEGYCDRIGEFNVWTVAGYYPVFLPEDDVPQANGVSSSLSLYKQVFAAPHCEEKAKMVS